MPTAYPAKANRATERDIDQKPYDPILVVALVALVLLAALAIFGLPLALPTDTADATWLMGP